ncbi:unnamed protein product, partial [Phaeothamnion confervicola]
VPAAAEFVLPVAVPVPLLPIVPVEALVPEVPEATTVEASCAIMAATELPPPPPIDCPNSPGEFKPSVVTTALLVIETLPLLPPLPPVPPSPARSAAMPPAPLVPNAWAPWPPPPPTDCATTPAALTPVVVIELEVVTST